MEDQSWLAGPPEMPFGDIAEDDAFEDSQPADLFDEAAEE